MNLFWGDATAMVVVVVVVVVGSHTTKMSTKCSQKFVFSIGVFVATGPPLHYSSIVRPPVLGPVP
jgi:hypothetical protein